MAQATIATSEELRATVATAGQPPRGTGVCLYEIRSLAGEGWADIFVGSELFFNGHTGSRGKQVVICLLCIGDVGHFDADGRLFVDVGDVNVLPREVEDRSLP